MRTKIKQIKGQRDQRSNRSTFAKIKDQKDQLLKDQRSKRSRDQRSTKFKGQRSKVKDQKKLTSDQEVNFWKVQRSKNQRSNQLFELSSRKTGAVFSHNTVMKKFDFYSNFRRFSMLLKSRSTLPVDFGSTMAPIKNIF